MSRAGPHHGKIVQIMGQLNPLRPRNQILVVGGMLAAGAPSGFYTGTTVETLKVLKRSASFYRTFVGPMTRIASAAGSVESAWKLNQGGYKPAFTVSYTPYDVWWVPPIPHIGEVIAVRQHLELGAEKIQSRGVEHTASSGTTRVTARKSMRGPLAQKRKSRSRFRRDEERYRGRRT